MNLSNADFAGLPFFVDDPVPSDHKCGGCIFRVKADKGYTCSVVNTKIDLSRGTCLLWAKGIECIEKPNASRVSPVTAGYVEADAVNCGSCKHYDVNGHEGCALWNAKVDKGQCCMVWEGR